MSTTLLRLKHLSARNLAIASIALSGAVHLLIIPEQLSHSGAHASFFALLGVAQLLWALFFRWRPAAPIYWAGVGLSGGVVIMCLLAFFVSTPFSSHVEPVDAYLLATKIFELIGLLALITHGAAAAIAATDRSSKTRLVFSPLIASVIFGTMVWGGGGMTELLFSGSDYGHSLESDQAHADSHPHADEGGETDHPDSLPANPADIQAMADAAVEAALLALEASHSSADSGGETPNVFSATGESNLPVDSASSPSPVLPSETQVSDTQISDTQVSDIRAMVAAAVEAAVSPEIIATPSPGLPRDIPAPEDIQAQDIQETEIQAIVAAAVEAALNPDLALMPTPGPLTVHQGLITATAVEANLLDHEPEHQHDAGNGNSPAEESVPIPLPDRPEPATPLPSPRLVGSRAALAPIAQTPQPPQTLQLQQLQQRTDSFSSFLPGEEKSDLKVMLFGTALVALTLIAVVGAVKTWNDII